MNELNLYKDHEITFSCIEVKQPIGVFYLASIPADYLLEITYVDVRDITDTELDKYLGIQRKVDSSRKRELEQYVNTVDACFPSGIILAVPPECAKYNSKDHTMTLASTEHIPYNQIAKILDGQHRIVGLEGYKGNAHEFELNVSIFVDADIEEQAYIFSTVNLAQTKVNKSLVYDLYEHATTRSPQKLCHNIAVTLNTLEDSPLYHKIKRLGCATPGRDGETITQATFVKALMAYISRDPIADRDIYKRKKTPPEVLDSDRNKLIFRNMMVREQDMLITDIIFNYFSAVKERWPQAWDNIGIGNILNKTNGFRALMRFMRDVYLHIVQQPNSAPAVKDFLNVLQQIKLEDFSVENYTAGSSGEGKLYRELLEQSRINKTEGCFDLE